jgi:uncharacterized protein YcbK (DUF882 family)
MVTDFLDQNIGASKYFKWREALYLKQWDVHAFPKTESVYLSIIEVSAKLDLIREIVARPLIVTSWYRPEKYNTFIKGSFDSAHKYGLACDFVVNGIGAQTVREMLIDELEKLDIRMENLPTAGWIHIDIREPGNSRYFQP